MEDKKRSVDFWGGAGVEFDSKKAIKALQEKVTANRKDDAAYYEEAPRLTLALQTKPRSADAKAEMSIFQAFKGITPDTLKGAMVKVDPAKGTVTFAGFPEDASGLMALDRFLQESGALRRTNVTRSKGWAFVSDPALASTPKLAPTDRVGSIPNARQISIALPPAIALALPSWAGASLMIGFFVEAARVGLTESDLQAFLQAKRAEKAEKEKEKAKQEAEKAKQEAEKAKQEAEKDEKEAEKAKQEAEKDEKEAEKDEKEAEKDEKEAEKDEKEAEKDEKDQDQDQDQDQT